MAFVQFYTVLHQMAKVMPDPPGTYQHCTTLKRNGFGGVTVKINMTDAVKVIKVGSMMPWHPTVLHDCWDEEEHGCFVMAVG